MKLYVKITALFHKEWVSYFLTLAQILSKVIKLSQLLLPFTNISKLMMILRKEEFNGLLVSLLMSSMQEIKDLVAMVVSLQLSLLLIICLL